MAHCSSGHPPTHTHTRRSLRDIQQSSRSTGYILSRACWEMQKAGRWKTQRQSVNIRGIWCSCRTLPRGPPIIPALCNVCHYIQSPAIAVAFKNVKDLAYSHLKFIVLHFGDEANKDDTQLFYPNQHRYEG